MLVALATNEMQLREAIFLMYAVQKLELNRINWNSASEWSKL